MSLVPRNSPTVHSVGLISVLESGGMPRERIIEYLDVSPSLLCKWAEGIEPMPADEYAALLALLTDMTKDFEVAVADAEAACDVEAARDGRVWLAAARELLASVNVDEP